MTFSMYKRRRFKKQLSLNVYETIKKSRGHVLNSLFGEFGFIFLSTQAAGSPLTAIASIKITR